MSEFTPINTQEEFDTAIKDRLSRQEAKIRGEYAGYEDLKKQQEAWGKEKESYEKAIAKGKEDYDDINGKLTEAQGKIAKYESEALRTKVAIEFGLPSGLFGYLKGDTEEEIRQSAEELGKFTKGSHTPPMADPEGDPPKDGGDAAFLRLARSLNGRKEN